MSGVAGKATEATKSAVGGATKTVGDTTKSVGNTVGETTKDVPVVGGKKDVTDKPRTIPEDVSEAQSHLDQSDGDDTGSEMVPAAGKVNENGEVVDDDGKVIGKVSSDNAKELAGSVVTQEGDILDEDGGVVGKAEPLEDVASELGNYTTKSQSNLGGLTDKASGAADKVAGGAKDTAEGATKNTTGDLASKLPTDALEGVLAKFQQPFKVDDDGKVTDAAGNVVGNVAEGVNISELPLEISEINPQGQLVGDDQSVLGQVELAPEDPEILEKIDEAKEDVPDVEGEVGGVKDKVDETAKEAPDAEGAVGDVKDKVDETADGAPDAEGAAGDVKDKVDETKEGVEDAAEDLELPDISTLEGLSPDKEGNVLDKDGNVLGKVKSGDIKKLLGKTINEKGQVLDSKGKVIGEVEAVPQAVEEAAEEAEEAADDLELPDISTLEGLSPDKEGNVLDKDGNVLGKVKSGDIKKLLGKTINEKGQVLDSKGKVIGEVEAVPQAVEEAADEAKDTAEETAEDAAENIELPDISSLEGLSPDKEGNVIDKDGKVLGKIKSGDIKKLAGKTINEKGQILDDKGKVIGEVEVLPQSVEEAAEDAAEDAAEEIELPDISILEGLTPNKLGNVTDKDGKLLGRVKSGDIKKLYGKTIDDKGQIWDQKGNVIGEVEVLPEAVEALQPPFEDFPDAVVDKNGKVIFEGQQVGVVVGDDFKKLIGKKVDADGDILDKYGNVLGKAERQDPEEEPEPEPEATDYSILVGKKVNKAGNVVDDKGSVWGHVVQGILKLLIGKKVGDNGEIYNDAGKVIGKAEPIPENEREDFKEDGPFEDFPDAIVESDGKVLAQSGGEQVGIVVEGDAKKLKGKKVDSDGDICDKSGNVLGRAERWEAPEEEPEPEVDRSALAGKRINKAGNAVDKSGDIYGRVVEGELSRLVGKMCDKTGAIRNEGGDVIGRAELIPEAEREGMKEGPFTELQGCTVTKEGKVVTPGGDVVGRLVSGDPKVLFGRAVDDDGDICDKNGNVLGKAERWEEPEEEKDINPMSGRKVNREGNVVDENGDVIGKLTSGELSVCAGKKIDDDGDVVDSKGATLGHVSLLEDIPEPEPEPEGETEEEKQERLEREKDEKLAAQMATCIEQSLDKIKPICKMITTLIDKEERKKEEDRDEEELVRAVRPLIEEGGKILTEANGVIRGLDPDGRISANAKHKTAAREASPAEYRLADLLKELTGSVTECIDNAKRKIEDMPHAKKELNPLWGLLAEPLGQILAAVGLLLSGVLGLVGRLLSGLGLGGLVDGLLGGLGLKGILQGLGLGSITDSLTGKKKK